MSNKTDSISPNRPDTWLEGLGGRPSTQSSMDETVKALFENRELLSAGVPLVLLGENAGSAAVENLARTFSLQEQDLLLNSFSLANVEEISGKSVSFPAAHQWCACSGVLCLDDTPASYSNAIEFCYRHDLAIPILADFESIPAQASQISVSEGEQLSEIYIYNYFTKLYRVKDPLQLVCTAYWDDGRKNRLTRVIGPNENLLITAKDFSESVSPADGSTFGTLVYKAHHPAFGRIPNSRFRCYADYRSNASCYSAHGDELEPKRAEDGEWFDTHTAVMDQKNDVILVIRNQPDSPNKITANVTAEPLHDGQVQTIELQLGPDVVVKKVSLRSLFGFASDQGETRFTCRVSGESYRLEWIEARDSGDQGVRFAANHGSTNDVSLMGLIESEIAPDLSNPDVLIKLAALEKNDVLALPYALPVMPSADPLEFSFSATKFLPQLDHLDVVGITHGGEIVGRSRLELSGNQLFYSSSDLPFADKMSRDGGLMFLCPPYVDKEWVTYDNCREDLWIKVTNRLSDDSDITEFQLHNRNTGGYTVPIGFGQAPNMIKARSDLMIRYRLDEDHDTTLVLINASPNLKFDVDAQVELELNLPNGRSSTLNVEIPAQSFSSMSMREIVSRSNCDAHTFGWVRILSNNTALAGYAIVQNQQNGSVAIQHLLGA